MFELHELTRLVKKRKRVGRGGKLGGTSGKGNKGQNARSGGRVGPGFEGGQMPLHRRLPKRGFTNAPFAKEVKIINVSDLERHFNTGERIDVNSLIKSKIISAEKGQTYTIKVLAKGTLSKKLHVVADAFSNTAKEAIENAGGTVEYTHKGE